MMKKTLAATVLTVGLSTLAQAGQHLEVKFDGCRPLEVVSNEDSCGNGPDPVNLACRPNNGPVRWVPLSSIAEIGTKPGSPGALHNCKAHPNQGYYQCIVTGNTGDEVSYFVTPVGDCAPLDPVIRIK